MRAQTAMMQPVLDTTDSCRGAAATDGKGRRSGEREEWTR